MENDFFKPTHPTKVWKILYFFLTLPLFYSFFLKSSQININPKSFSLSCLNNSWVFCWLTHYFRPMDSKWPSTEDTDFLSVQLDCYWQSNSALTVLSVQLQSSWIQLNRQKVSIFRRRPFTDHRTNIVNYNFNLFCWCQKWFLPSN